jgi:peptidoglycan/LPS O-acetylase OafA/YrhL
LVARILSTPAFVFLGEISFALYLVHLTVWSMMGGFNLEHSYIKQDSALNFLVCVILSLAIATILYKFIEVPYRKTLRKHWKTAPSVPVPDLCEN